MKTNAAAAMPAGGTRCPGSLWLGGGAAAGHDDPHESWQRTGSPPDHCSWAGCQPWPGPKPGPPSAKLELRGRTAGYVPLLV